MKHFHYCLSRFCLLLLLFLTANAAKAADYYWIGGSGSWNDLTHWATTSGGTTNPSIVPSAADNVFFDANSFPLAGGTVTISFEASCNNFTVTADVGTGVIFSFNAGLVANGAITVASTDLLTWNQAQKLNAGNGGSLSNVKFTMNSGEFKISSGNLSLTNGSDFTKSGSSTDLLQVSSGTISVDGTSKFTQNSGLLTVGSAISVPSGGTFTSSASDKNITGGFEMLAGSKGILAGPWRIHNGGFQLDLASSVTTSSNLHIYLDATSAATHYIKSGGKDLRWVELSIPNVNAEYRLADKLIAKGTGLDIYANKFKTDGYDMDLYRFYNFDVYYNPNYTPNTNNSSIDITDSEISVLYEFRLRGDAYLTSFSSTGSTIIFNGNSYQQLYAPKGGLNDLIFNNGGNNSQIYIYVDNNSNIRDITINATGTPFLFMNGSKKIRNFTFNNLNTSSASGNWQEIHGNNEFTGAFTYTSVNPNVRHKFYTSSSNKFNVLNWNSGISDWKIGSNSIQTITDLTDILGTCSRNISIYSSSAGLQGTISQVSGTVQADYVFLQDVRAQGGAAFSASNAVSGGNVTGWSFVPVAAKNFYWIGGSGNWNDPAHWSLSSGGSAGCAIPSRIDNVFFDVSSFASASEFVTINAAAECKSMVWENTMAGAGMNGTSDLSIYGSLKLSGGMNYLFAGSIYFQSNSAGNTIETAGKTILGNTYFNGQNSSAGSWTLADAFTSNGFIYPNYGKLISNGKSINVQGLQGGGTLDLSGTNVLFLKNFFYFYGFLVTPITTEIRLEGTSNQSFYGFNSIKYPKVTVINTNPSSAQIYIYMNGSEISDMDVTHAGTGQTLIEGYNSSKIGDLDITYTSNTNQLAGAVDFNFHSLLVSNFNFKSTGQIRPSINVRYNTSYTPSSTSISFSNFSTENAGEWVLSSGGNKTFGNISIKGSCVQKTMFRSYNSPGTANPITCTGLATADHCILKDITITGGGTYTATNSINGGNVTGWPVSNVSTNYYWIGGTGNWGDPAHWSLSSGGTSAGCLPSQADNVFFDVNSFTAANQVVTVNVPAYFKNMVWQNVNQPRISGSQPMNCYGSLELAANLQWQYFSTFYFQSRNDGNTIKTNGVRLNQVYFNGDNSVLGGWELEDDFASNSNVYLKAGRFKTNGFKLTASNLINDINSSALSLDITGSEVVLSSQLTLQPLINFTSTNSQISFANSSSVTLNGANKNFNNLSFSPPSAASTITLNGNNVYNNVNLSTPGYPTVTLNGSSTFNDITASFSNSTGNIPRLNFVGSNTVNTLTVTSTGLGSPYITLSENNTFNSLIASGLGTRLYIGSGKIQTVNGLLALGNGNYPVTFQSTTTGVQGTVYKQSGKICLDYVQMRDIKADGLSNGAGGIQTQFFAGGSSVNVGNNTNWTFSSCEAYYWVGDNGNWSDYASHWARTSGGTTFHTEAPGPEDDVIFDANSFTIAGRVVNIDVPVAQSKSMNWSSAAFTPTLTGSGVVEIYGDLVLTAAMNQNHTGHWKFKGNNNNNVLNPAGRSLPNVDFDGGISGQGKWTLQNPLWVQNDLNFNNGTLITNNKAVTTKNFSSGGSNTRTLDLGSSTITIKNGTFDAGTLTNTSLVEGTSSVIVTGDALGSFIGKGLTYHNLTFEGAPALQASLSGNNAFKTLTVKPGVHLQIAAGSTQVVSQLVANGLCNTPINIQSTVAGSPAAIQQATGTVNVKFVDLKDITAGGGATFNAIGSTNSGGNNGWIFSAAQPLQATTSFTYVSCTANNDGTASVTNVTGGEAPYAYLWSTSETTSSISNLIIGTYTVTITDALGCSLVKTVEVTNTPGMITAVPFSASKVDICLGETISFTAGTPEESVSGYRWSFGDFTSSTFQNPTKTYNAAGTYTVALSYLDANGCPAKTTQTVRVSNVQATVAATNISCKDAGNGIIEITPSGGFEPYTYSINNGANYVAGNKFENLAPATYQIKVKDALGCVSPVTSRTLTQPAIALSFLAAKSGLACPTTKDGTITITASGGTAPYSYSINNGITFATTNKFENLEVGAYLVVVRDSKGCLTEAQTVSFSTTDITPPSITCAADIDLTVSTGCSKELTIPSPAVLDNCGVQSVVNSFTGQSNANGTYPLGITEVVWTVTDINGLTKTCTQKVIIRESVPPTASCKSLDVQLGSNGEASVTAADLDAGSSDNCGSVTVTIASGQTSYTCADVNKTFDVVLSVRDARGNTATCTTKVTVKDDLNPCNRAPVAACKNITVSANSQCQAAVSAEQFNNGSSDPDGDALTFSISPAGPFAPGTTNVTVTVSDGKGKSAQCQATITVVDATAPALTCPAPVKGLAFTKNTDPGKCTYTIPANELQPTATDNCSGSIAYYFKVNGGSYSNASEFTGTELQAGENLITWKAVDAAGNTSQECSYTVAVTDDQDPTISSPANIQNRGMDAGQCYATVDLGTPVTRDNCGVASVTNDAPATFPKGTTTVTWTVTDVNGRTQTATQTVQVVDDQKPNVVTQNLTVQLNGVGQASVTAAQIDNGSSDACGIKSRTLDKTSFDCTNIGANTVILTVEDNNGNTKSATATVTVEDKVKPAVLTKNITVQLNAAGAVTVGAAEVNNGSSDACGIKTMTLSKTSFDCSNVGANTVTLTVEDNNGNMDSKTATITVEDKLNPVLTTKAATLYLSAEGTATLTVSNVLQDADDNCSVDATGFRLSQAAFNCSHVGENTVTLTVTDVHGNTSNETATVTVVDNTAPSVTTKTASLYLDADGNATLAVGDVFVSASDNCSLAATQGATLSKTAFNCSNVGANTVTVYKRDANGNTGSSTATVTVVDNVKPTVLTQAVTLNLNAGGAATLTVAQVDNGSSDACGIKSMTLSKTSFGCSDVGANTVTLTVVDNNNNTHSKTATITVRDLVLPAVAAQNITVNLNAQGSAAITAQQVDNGSSDACGIRSMTLDKTNFDCSNVGANTVTLTVVDNNGNTNTATATVTVVDDIKPTITIPAAQKLRFLAPPNHKMVEVPLDYVVTDNCTTGLTYSISVVNSEENLSIGDGNTEEDYKILEDKHKVLLRAERSGTGEGRTYTITVTASDASGNTHSDFMEVIVAHNITSPVSGKAFKIGSTLPLAGTFWDKAGNKHTGNFTIDGTTTVRGSVTEPSGRKNGTVTGSYKFTTPGVYKLQMNVTDQTGVTTYANTNGELDAIVVIYDPNGGYTVGGGWFSSPAGALSRDALAKGPVSFGFQTNYFKGATLPKGETQFDFKVGDLEFNALNFDYLVVDKAKAQFKGSGKIIGGQSGINFLMTVIDGALDGTGVDKIRMKIYNKNTGEVYYDSQPGASDAADPTTVVGTGSIIEIGGTNLSAPITAAPLSNDAKEQEEMVAQLEVKVMPNPSTHYFTLVTQSRLQQPLSIRVMDNGGRVVETKVGVAANGRLLIGSNFRPGIYYVEILQGRKKQTLKLIKLPD